MKLNYRVNRIDWEQDLLSDLKSMTYEEVAQKHGTSRGTVYAIALRHGARKHELRITERAKERRSRRKAFLQDVLDATVKMDVLDYLDGIPDNSIDLYVTSPPYSIGKSYEPSGGGQYSLSFYLGWLLQVTSEMARTLSNTGTMCLQLGNTKLPDGRPYPIDALLTEHLRGMGLQFESRIIWTASHGLTPKSRLAERYETVLVFSKGEEHIFNANACRSPQKQPDKRAYKGSRKGQLSGHPLGAAPTNVWSDIGNVKNNSPDRKACGNHPAPFPVQLAHRLIMLYSMPGNVVADPFCGSGSTCVASKKSGRAFTGADLFYEDLRSQRLANVAPDLVSPLDGITDRSVAVWQAEAKPICFDAIPENAEYASEEFMEDLFASQM